MDSVAHRGAPVRMAHCAGKLAQGESRLVPIGTEEVPEILEPKLRQASTSPRRIPTLVDLIGRHLKDGVLAFYLGKDGQEQPAR